MALLSVNTVLYLCLITVIHFYFVGLTMMKKIRVELPTIILIMPYIPVKILPLGTSLCLITHSTLITLGDVCVLKQL